MLRRTTVLAALVLLSACKTTGGFPDPKDVAAVVEVKPQPGDDILTDTAAGDRYDSAIEGWGDRVRAAGMRLCRFYERVGMPDIECPGASTERVDAGRTPTP